MTALDDLHRKILIAALQDAHEPRKLLFVRNPGTTTAVLATGGTEFNEPGAPDAVEALVAAGLIGFIRADKDVAEYFLTDHGVKHATQAQLDSKQS